jgi:translation initiation factor 2B subunit (eIF-2B alpha/beta/delta family)
MQNSKHFISKIKNLELQQNDTNVLADGTLSVIQNDTNVLVDGTLSVIQNGTNVLVDGTLSVIQNVLETDESLVHNHPSVWMQ